MTPPDAPLADRLLLRPAEAAVLLSISRAEVYRRIQRGELRTVRIGSQLRVPQSAITQFVADLERASRVEQEHWQALLARPKRKSG